MEERGERKEDGGLGKEGKGTARKRGGERKCKEAKVKYGGFVDGSHEWEREGSGDCGITVVIKESGASKSSRHGVKRHGGLCTELFILVNTVQYTLSIAVTNTGQGDTI